MKIRNIKLPDDFPELRRAFATQGLDDRCFPDLVIPYKNKAIVNPRYIVKKVVESTDGKVALAGFVKIVSEAYLLIDHSLETPEWRWEALQNLTEDVAGEAKIKGVDCLTAFVPDEIIKSFGPRLEAMKFVPSAWKSYSRLL